MEASDLSIPDLDPVDPGATGMSFVPEMVEKFHILFPTIPMDYVEEQCKDETVAQYRIPPQSMKRAQEWPLDSPTSFERFPESEELTRENLKKTYLGTSFQPMSNSQITEDFSSRAYFPQENYLPPFHVEEFITIFPNPFAQFSDRHNTIRMDTPSCEFALSLLMNLFDQIAMETIQQIFQDQDQQFYRTFLKIRRLVQMRIGIMKGVRRRPKLLRVHSNLPLFHQVACALHEEEIVNYLRQQHVIRSRELERAHYYGNLQTCNQCNNSKVLLADAYHCTNNCTVCKECLVRKSRIRTFNNTATVLCPNNACATGFFHLDKLRRSLSTKLFATMARKNAVDFMKRAGADELELCPFCHDFAAMPCNDEDGTNIYRCVNPICLRDSCRLCKQLDHTPLNCSEAKDLQNRTYANF